MRNNIKKIAVFGSAGVIAGLVILIVALNFIPDEPKPIVLDKEIFSNTPSEFFESTHELKKISSQAELLAFFKEVEKLSHSTVYSDFAVDESFAFRATSGPVPEPMWNSAMEESLQLAPSHGGIATFEDAFTASKEYSTTNVQVQNVDEPDFMKNDGKYLYILSGDKLSIIDAYPAEQAKVILKIGLDVEHRNLQDMFLNGDRLVIFYDSNERVYTISRYNYEPDYTHTPKTHALILDISEKDNPKILKDYDVDGRYHNARMIGDYVYFISQKGIDYSHPIMPMIRESSSTIIEPEIFYFDNPEIDYNFSTVTAFDIFGDAINSETFLMGHANTIYVSEDSIYVTYQKNLPYNYYDTLQRDRFYDVIVPLLPRQVQDQIKSIESDDSLDWYQKWEKVSDLLLETFNSMPENMREKLFRQIQWELEEYDSKVIKSSTRTIVHKIGIDKDDLTYESKGEVPGYLLNQFSMDEHNGKLRLATTSSFNGRHTSFTHNNVYVLDENLEMTGSLENIAPDETIYSARFMGEKLYLVTFQRIDPFFVIDLSGNNPKVLGELKIPGFSNYLHPYDEDHIIGIGKDTEDRGGGVRTLGLKMALFDVSDFHNPITVDTVVIGDQSTESEVLQNHKAFLLDVEKNILSFPVRDYNRDYKIDEKTGERIRYSENWLGFYVYGINPEKGFEQKGIIEHYSGNGHDYAMNGFNRSFYIEEVFYTVSSELIKMNDIENIEKEVNELQITGGPQIVKYFS